MSGGPRRRALVRREADRTLVLAPAPGYWTDAPPPGVPLSAGSEIGRLQTLGRRVHLILPAGVAGVWDGELPAERRVAVEFGEVLLELRAPAQAVEEAGPAPAEGAARTSDAEGFAVLAPTDGVFYHRPAPGAPPFVEAGQRVRRGQTVGLVEAMKTFNPIVYEGPGAPQVGEVLEIRCGDGDEIRGGQVLLVVGRAGRSAAPAGD